VTVLTLPAGHVHSGGIDVHDIVALYDARMLERGPVLREMMAVRDTYNGDLVVPLPELDREERAAVANLLHTGLEQMSMRVSSTLPSVFCPSRDETRKRENVQARTRTQAIYGWWQKNDLKTIQRRRARWLLGYACAPAVIKPNAKLGIPEWHARDPLTTFPSAPARHDDMTPENVVFSFVRSFGWLAKQYPEAFEAIRRPKDCRHDELLTVLEYVDADEVVMVAFGDRNADPALVAGPRGRDSIGMGGGRGGMRSWVGTEQAVELHRIPNRAGLCTAVIPGRVTLDRMMSQYAGMIGMFQMQAKLMALEVIAVEKGVFPDLYLIGRPGETPQFLSGPHDGRTGLVNIVTGGEPREISTNAGFQTNPTMDRLERAMRLEGGVPADFGGESSSNVRTGRRGENLLSAAVDFPVQEQQELLATALQHENVRAIAVAKGYFGNKTTSFYVSWKGARGGVEYKANEVFTTDENIVSYPHAGSDQNGLTIMVGQAVGMGIMSKKTAASLMSIIDDEEFEHDQGVKEALEAAMLAGIQQKVNAGEIAPVDTAWLMQQIGNNKLELAEAIIKLDERVQRRQAEAQAQQADPALADPMAGLATGTPAEAQVVPPAIGEPPEAQQNLASILGSLRMPQMRVPSERSA
jgi:hypothetical protein